MIFSVLQNLESIFTFIIILARSQFLPILNIYLSSGFLKRPQNQVGDFFQILWLSHKILTLDKLLL